MRWSLFFLNFLPNISDPFQVFQEVHWECKVIMIKCEIMSDKLGESAMDVSLGEGLWSVSSTNDEFTVVHFRIQMWYQLQLIIFSFLHLCVKLLLFIIKNNQKHISTDRVYPCTIYIIKCKYNSRDGNFLCPVLFCRKILVPINYMHCRSL